MIFLSKETIESTLPMEECLSAMTEAFDLLHKNEGFHALRKRIHLPGGTTAWGNLLSMMPAYYNKDYLGAKVFTVYPDNSGTELPTHQGLVLLFDSHTGSLLACADANKITELRTATTTALATKLLSNKDASICAFIGAGAQAYLHIKALLLVRNFSLIKVWLGCQNLAPDYHKAHRI